MSRKIVFLFLFALAGTTGRTWAQYTALKWNALYWLAGVPNMSVETRLGERVTFNGDLVCSPWRSIKGRPMQVFQIIPEVRYYPLKEAFRGLYIGGYVAYDAYKLSKWDHPKTDVQIGVGIGIGATLGWQIDLARRWGMDFYVGGGWHHGWYYGVDTRTGVGYSHLLDKSAEWLPYKAGVTIVYRLGRGMKGK